MILDVLFIKRRWFLLESGRYCFSCHVWCLPNCHGIRCIMGTVLTTMLLYYNSCVMREGLGQKGMGQICACAVVAKTNSVSLSGCCGLWASSNCSFCDNICTCPVFPPWQQIVILKSDISLLCSFRIRFLHTWCKTLTTCLSPPLSICLHLPPLFSLSVIAFALTSLMVSQNTKGTLSLLEPCCSLFWDCEFPDNHTACSSLYLNLQ